MTVFGKILAIFNLLFGLIVAGLCIFVFIAGMNNAAIAEKERKYREAAEAGEKSEKERADKLEAKLTSQQKSLEPAANVKPGDDNATVAKKVEDTIKTLTEERDRLVTRNNALEADNLTLRKRDSGTDATRAAMQTEIDQKNKELDRLKKNYDAEVNKNITLQKDAIAANQAKTAAEIERDALRDTNKGLEDRYQDIVKEVVRLRQQVLTAGAQNTGTGASLTARNPPTVAIEGKVEAVGRDGELIELSLGSDAGLQVGHTLEVFRMTPKPQYLGYVRITRVEHNKAVGQVIGKPIAPLQRGDNVASRILGS